jgi:hypothetical protein
MRGRMAGIVLIAIVTLRVVGLAASGFGAIPPRSSSDEPDVQHAMRGVIRAVNAEALVVSRPGRPGSELTLSLTHATDVEGQLVVGATVSVRYTRDKDRLIAIAVTVHPQQAALRLHSVE